MINYLSIIFAFLIAMLLTYFLIFIFKKKQLSQPILEDAPETHQKKKGTPTMGGLAFIFSIVICIVAFIDLNSKYYIPLVGLLLFGLIGYIDDFMKLYFKQNKGLDSRQKIVLQFVFSIIVGYLLKKNGINSINIPFMKSDLILDILFYPFVCIFFIAMTNSTNMTDGLDGLLSHVTIISAIFLVVIAFIIKDFIILNQMFIFMTAILGFLIFNKYPAKIIMGDTGSMAIGGFLGTVLLITNTPIFIIFAGIIYVMESLSVILQVWSFKTRGKRIFLMSPIHHHYEKKGFSENKVVYLFTAIQFVGVLIALLLFII